jgi:probable rRNA maturation factor
MNRTNNPISIQLTCETVCDDIDTAPLQRLVRRVCRQFEVRRATVTIAVVDDKIMRALHREFLGTDKTTDVMSFDLSEPVEKSKYFDIIVNVEQARRQAAKRGLSVQAETALYLVHGLLHQLGFDDIAESQARRMHQQEDHILKEAGLGNVYHSTRKG